MGTWTLIGFAMLVAALSLGGAEEPSAVAIVLMYLQAPVIMVLGRGLQMTWRERGGGQWNALDLSVLASAACYAILSAVLIVTLPLAIMMTGF